MNKSALILVLLSLNLSAYSDYDMDGVDDTSDQCPNTPFSELVDSRGCSIKSLVSPHHFDIILGVENSQVNYATLEKTDTLTQSLELDYYYKNFSLQVSTSHYNSQKNTFSESGMNDSFLGAYYNLKPNDTLIVRLGAGIILPTYDDELHNNNTDYTASVNLSYILEDMNLFAGYGYTIVTDDDIANTLTYQNTNAFTAGLGFYPSKNFYVSGAYNSSDSIYEGVEKINTASFYVFYNIDDNWFTNITYAHGLSDTASDNTVSVRLGHRF